MKFQSSATDFFKSMSYVLKALPNQKTGADFILNSVKIKAEKNEVTFSVENSELRIESKFNANVFIDGEALMSANRETEELFKNIDGDIECECIDNKFIIFKYSDSYINIENLDLKKYPDLNHITEDKKFKINALELKNMIRKTKGCVAQGNTRNILKGVFLEIKNKKATMVGLDGYKMACSSYPIETNEEIEIIIPYKTVEKLEEILKNTENNKEKAEISINKKRIKIKFKNTTVYSMLIKGKYIDYTKIIPSNYETEAIIEKKTLEHIINRTSIAKTSDGLSILRVEIKENIINIKASSEKINNISEKAPIILKGKDLIIGVNGEYIKNCLKNIESDYIKMKFLNSKNPCIIKEVDKNKQENDNYLYMYLPIKIN